MTSETPWWRKERPEKEWKLYEDFRVFLWLIWRHLDMPSPTPIQYDIADYLQSGPRRRIIMAFRGIGKSWITSAFVCWLLLRNPNHKIMVVSASKQRADDFSTFTLRLIREVPVLSRLIPGPQQRQSMVAFDVAPARPDHSPSVKSVGIFGQLTGSRADTIIADDVEVPNNSDTQGMRDKLSGRVKEFDAVLKPGGQVVYLGTPQCEDSLYAGMTERGYQSRIWPSRYPTKALQKNYGDRLAPKLLELMDRGEADIGVPTDTRFNDADLLEREMSYGRSGFALQFMLDTSLRDRDRYPLKLADLIVMSIDGTYCREKVVWSNQPENRLTELACVGMRGDGYYGPAATFGDWVEFNGCAMFIDPSGRGGDETGYAIIKMRNGFLYVVAAGGLAGGYEDHVMIQLATMAKEHKVNLIRIESNFGDGMFLKLFQPHLRRIHPCTTEDYRATKQKELRIIDTLEPVMNQHRLIVDPRVIENDRKSVEGLPAEEQTKYQLFYQMSRITRDRQALAKDDRLDALAGCVAYWLEQMGQDEDRKMQDHKTKLLDLELQNFHSGINTALDRLALGMSPEKALRGGSGRRRKGLKSLWH